MITTRELKVEMEDQEYVLLSHDSAAMCLVYNMLLSCIKPCSPRTLRTCYGDDLVSSLGGWDPVECLLSGLWLRRDHRRSCRQSDWCDSCENIDDTTLVVTLGLRQCQWERERGRGREREWQVKLHTLTVSCQFGVFNFGACELGTFYFDTFQFDAMPVWRIPLWRVSPISLQYAIFEGVFLCLVHDFINLISMPNLKCEFHLSCGRCFSQELCKEKYQ